MKTYTAPVLVIFVLGALSGCCETQQTKDPNADSDKAPVKKVQVPSKDEDKASEPTKEVKEVKEVKEPEPPKPDPEAEAKALEDKRKRLAKLAEVDLEKSDVQFATVEEGYDLLVTMGKESDAKNPDFKVSLVKGEEVAAEEGDLGAVVRDPNVLKKQFKDCSTWSGALVEPLGVGGQTAYKISLWCSRDAYPEDDEDHTLIQRELIIITQKNPSKSLDSVEGLSHRWIGEGSSAMPQGDDCIVNTSVRFNSVDGQTLQAFYTISAVYEERDASTPVPEEATEPERFKCAQFAKSRVETISLSPLD